MTLDTILVPTDGSDSSTNAARRGFDLAAAFDASVDVLSVADSTIATGAGYAGDSPSIRASLRETATERASALAEEASERGIDATAMTREGIPATEIVRCADENAIDAIVLGTAGRGGVVRAVVGSVADKVVRTAPVPVVTITPAAATGSTSGDGKSILLPTDGSEAASEAAAFGLDLATELGATVDLLTVIDSARSASVAALLGDDLASEKPRERVTERLEALATDAHGRGLDADVVVREGKPAEEIVAYAESNAVGLIAMGTVGLGGFGRFILGSVADEVIRTAPVPVLTSRPVESIDSRD